MKHKTKPILALSAALLLSGCNTDKAVTTTSDTTAVTEEVTTTEATTTAASTTTTSTTTAAPEPEKTYGIIPKEAEGVFEITAEPML
ncbi:MAG: lipoprotein, partial [Ruminiclostridium sp.]|nr:lipoprotein [Ruminiclostridium sp.]